MLSYSSVKTGSKIEYIKKHLTNRFCKNSSKNQAEFGCFKKSKN